jgi:hypothetical protein
MAAVGNHSIQFRILGNIVRVERVAYNGSALSGVLDPP